MFTKMSNRVYNDINDSNYYVELDKIKIYFSSEFNKERFLKGYEEYVKEENLKIQNKYKVNIIANYYLLFAYYRKIEKRGFKIINKVTGAEINNNLTFIIGL